MAKRLTRQQAINAKCKDCVYDKLDDGNWRQQVTRCNGTDCALYPHRPVSRPETRAARNTPTLAVSREVGAICDT